MKEETILCDRLRLHPWAIAFDLFQGEMLMQADPDRFFHSKLGVYRLTVQILL